MGFFEDNEKNTYSGNFIDDKLFGFGIYSHNSVSNYEVIRKMIFQMELVLNIGKIQFILANLKKEKKKVLVNIFGMMEKSIMGIVVKIS